MRQCCQPATGARCLAPAGDRHPAVARRVTPAHHPAAAHRKPHPRARSGGLRPCRLAAVTRGCSLRGDDDDAAGARRAAERRRSRCRLASPRVPRGRRDRCDGVLRARAGAAGHPPRTRADDARRRDERRTSGSCTTCPDRGPGRRIGSSPDLCRHISSKCFCCRDRESGRADERHADGQHRQRDAARCAAAGGDGRPDGSGSSGLVSSDACSCRDARCRRDDGGQISEYIEQIADRPDCRVAGILRCARHRRRERPRLHADRTHRGRGRRDGDRHSRAPALADSRCGRAGGPTPGSEVGIAGCTIALVRRSEQREGRSVRSSSSASCAT